MTTYRANEYNKSSWSRRFCFAVALSISAMIISSANAWAQQNSFSAYRFAPAISPLNLIMTENSDVLPHLSPSAALFFTYSHKPLLLVTDSVESSLIKYQIHFDMMLALGFFDWLELGIAAPILLAQETDGLTALGYAPEDTLGAGIGDLRLVPKVRIWHDDNLGFAISAPVFFPTGSEDNLVGGDLSFAPRLILSMNTSSWGMALNVGYHLRQDKSFSGPNLSQKVIIDDEVFGSLGTRLEIINQTLEVLGDFSLASSVREFDREEISSELAYGLRVYFSPSWAGTFVVSHGLTQGVGTPAFRLISGLSYHPVAEKVLPAEKKKPVVNQDADGDLIMDPQDRCPNEPEDKDGFMDTDGCPDADNDSDGVVDVKDKCPNEPEDKDGFMDEDGCPDADNDGDGIVDVKDKCPNDPEDKDLFQDEDGCPDQDNDRDGILDARDACPNEPEIYNGKDDEDGCPDKSAGPVQIEHGQVTTPPVYFATKKDVILRKSFRMLGQVYEVLRANQWIKKIRIEGHCDSQGDDAFNMDLSRRRAESVKKFLVDLGIEEARLEAQGFGETKPIADNRTAKGRAKNRRVDFVIVDPAQ